MYRGHLIFKTLKNPGNTAHGRLCKRGRTPPPPGEQLATNPPRAPENSASGVANTGRSPRAPQKGKRKKKEALPALQQTKLPSQGSFLITTCIHYTLKRTKRPANSCPVCGIKTAFSRGGRGSFSLPVVLPGQALPGRLRPCAPVRPQFHSLKVSRNGYMSVRQQLPWTRKNAGLPAPQAEASG